MAISNDARIRAAFHCGRARKLLATLNHLHPDPTFAAAIAELERVADCLGGVAPTFARGAREPNSPGGSAVVGVQK
jgi:hypothetical protein